MKEIDYYKIKNLTEIHIIDRHVENNYTYFKVYEKKKFLRPNIIMHDIFKIVKYDDYMGDGGKNTYYESINNVLAHKVYGGQREFIIDNDNLVYHRVMASIVFSHRGSCGYPRLFDTIEEAIEWAENLLTSNKLDKEILKIK